MTKIKGGALRRMGGKNMKHLFKKLTVSAASALIAAGSLNCVPLSFAADDSAKKDTTITFDMSDPDIYFAQDDNGDPVKPADIKSKTGTGIKMPSETPLKRNFTFVGWTADGIYGYEPGDIFRTNEESVVMKPVFREKGNATYTVSYKVDMGGEIIDTSEDLPDALIHVNAFYKPSFMSYQNSEKKSVGWTDGEHLFLQEQKFIMPEHDVTLTPIWHRRLTLTYSAGDYDNIVGGHSAVFDVIESQVKDIADGSRFSRIGYEIDHWHCDYDDQDYAFLSSFTMPDEYVTMTAVWKPITYNIVFQTKVSGVPSIKVPGTTGETIKVPEMTAKKDGFTFGGWTLNDKTYMPGDDFYVEGAMPGVGISLTPVWLAEGETTTTTTTVTTTKIPETTETTSVTTTKATESSTTTSAATTKASETSTTTSAATTSATTTKATETSTTTSVTTSVSEKNYIKVNVVDENGEFVNNVKICYTHNIETIVDGKPIYTGPIEIMDTSVANPLYIMKGTGKNDKSYLTSFKIVNDEEMGDVTPIPDSDIKETNSENNTDYTITIKGAVSVKYGDANNDGQISLADAVLIMQSIANPDKYGEKGTDPNHITAEGKKNGDVAGGGDGITNADALAIQQFMLKMTDKLPVAPAK